MNFLNTEITMINFIRDFFLPHEKNNHRAKILHNVNIVVLLLVLLFTTFSTQYLERNYPNVLGISYSISETDLLNLVNKERAEKGLSPLKYDPRLSDAARRKAADMFEKDYWAHFAPDGQTSPWGFIREAGYNYMFAGENLAKGFTDSSSAVEAWMGSQTHRDNILSDRFEDIGFAIIPGTLSGEETVLIVEMFGTTSQPFVATNESATQESQLVPDVGDSVGGETKEAEIELLAQINEEPLVIDSSQSGEAIIIKKPVIDVSDASKAISVAGFSFLAFAFMMDLAIVERKKIPRTVGHNLDHIMLLAIFIMFILLTKGGVIL